MTCSTSETLAFGRRLGERLGAGDVVALAGPLGSGKTYLVKGIALGLGVEDSREVRSPTFILIGEYVGRLRVYHVDAYRLRGAPDFEALGSDEMLFGDGVTLIEWADRVESALPTAYLRIECDYAGETQRRYRLIPCGRRYEEVVGRLRNDSLSPGLSGGLG